MMAKTYQMLPLEGLVNFKTGKLNSNAAKPDGKYPFFTCSQETFRTDTWSFDGEYVLLAGNNAAGIYPLKYFIGKFDAYQRTYAISTLNKNSLNNRYLYFALRPQLELLKSISTGAATKFLTLKLLNQTEIPVPPLPTQRKIAAILSAYDDLIENNLRRIKILEEMAQNLYREWFVKFRFPGWKKAKFVDSELGRIPEGWEIKTLGELAVVVTKGTTPTTLGKKFQDEGINFLKVESIDQAGGIEENKLAKIDLDTHKLLKRSQLQAGDILFSIAGAIGRTTILPQRIIPANTNQALAIIRILDEVYRIYTFHCIRADEFQHFSLGRVVQTAQANVSLGILKSAPIVVPTETVLNQFVVFALYISQMQENIGTRNLYLRRTRDLLLPKLISGKIDVSDMDIDIGANAA